MRTTLNLNDELIKEIINITKAKTKTEAINIVLQDYIKQKSFNQLLELRGKLHIENTYEKLREMEKSEF